MVTLSRDDDEDLNPNPREGPYGVESGSTHLYDVYLRMGSWACTLDGRSCIHV
jgi:hypothetical protein